MKKLRRHLTPILLGGFLAAACLGVAPEDVRYAARPTVAIRQGKFAFDPVIATAQLGEPLTVIAQDGRWLRVSYAPNSFASTQPAAPIQGYVLEDALATQRPATTQPVEVKNAPIPGGVLNSSEYAPANGLAPDALAKAINDSQQAMKNADAKFEAFTKAGHVGPHKAAAAASGPTTQPSH